MALNVAFISMDGGKPTAIVTNFESAAEIQADIDSCRGEDGREKVVSFVKAEGVIAEMLSALVGTEIEGEIEDFLTQIRNA
jgi:hypothetical protein